MKKLLVFTVLGLSTFVSFTNLKAEDNKTEENIGFASGLVIGALAGGPVGAIIGAASGVWLGGQVNDAEKVGPLTSQIAKNKTQLISLKASLSERNNSLDKANILLQQQEVNQQRVAQNKQLMQGLQVDLMFRTNSRILETGAIEKIAPLVLMLEQFPQLELQLTGHGDVLGSVEENNLVAHERTLTVQQAFINAGIKHQRIHLRSSGKDQAVALIDDLDGRALDRRVRVQFMQAVGKASLAKN